MPDCYQGVLNMLETLVVILIVLWLVGLLSSYTMGGLIHLLLVIAIVVILIRVIQGRRV
jgi:hypothetical protein